MKKEFEKAGNPYMPMWEHVPDGEPRVFVYNGEERVYVYGSHDTCINEYCGLDYVVWSAPTDDLSNWKCHGTCFTSRDGMPLYAPDVVQKGDTFYMYVAEARGSKICVASSKNPAGPFENPIETELGFDPGILVDDDGKVYAFWGFCKSWCAELEDDMVTIKKETIRENHIGHCSAPWSRDDDGHLDFEYGFFEASSPRKINGKYIFIYSKNYNEKKPELGVVPSNNGFLSYAYSDSPLHGYAYGGDISFNGGEIITLPDGEKRMTYQWGNNHGSIVEIKGKWYVFYHRQTGLNEYSRQAMIEPIEVAFNKEGKPFIGEVIFEKGEPIKSVAVQHTSSGAKSEGLDPYKIISAGRACHIYDGQNIATSDKESRPYVKPVYEKKDDVSSPICGIKNGTTIGFKYLLFENTASSHVSIKIKTLTETTVEVIIGNCDGKKLGSAKIPPESDYVEVKIPIERIEAGKWAIYFRFLGGEGVIAEFDSFSFDR